MASQCLLDKVQIPCFAVGNAVGRPLMSLSPTLPFQNAYLSIKYLSLHLFA